VVKGSYRVVRSLYRRQK